MKKRQMAIAATLAAVLGAIVLTVALLPGNARVTEANFDRLEAGMTRAEVEAIFGCPCSESIWSGSTSVSLDGAPFNGWQGPDGWALIRFNHSGRIDYRRWYIQKPTVWEKLQRMLPWLPD